MLLKARLNKNYITVSKKHVDHTMHLVTQNIHVVTGNISTIHSNNRACTIVDIAAQIIADLPSCFTVGTRHSGFQVSLGVRPDGGYKTKDDHQTILRISSRQTSMFYDHHTISFVF